MGSKVNEFARNFLYVALACVGALQLFQFVLAQYAMARFWESWVVQYPVAATYGPLCVVALASGAFVGMVVGILARGKALVIAAWAGLCACLLSFISAAAAGGFAWAVTNVALVAAPLIAGGLLLGALLGRKLRHA